MSKVLQLRAPGAERMRLDLALFDQRVRDSAAEIMAAPPPPEAPGFDYDLWRDALAQDLRERAPLLRMDLDPMGVKAQGPSSRRVAAGALIGVTLFGAGAAGALRSVVKPGRPVTRLAMIEIAPPAAVSAIVAATPNLARLDSLDPTPTATIPAAIDPLAGAQAQKPRIPKASPPRKPPASAIPLPQARPPETPDLLLSLKTLLTGSR